MFLIRFNAAFTTIMFRFMLSQIILYFFSELIKNTVKNIMFPMYVSLYGPIAKILAMEGLE